jgi:hypothetical protein
MGRGPKNSEQQVVEDNFQRTDFANMGHMTRKTQIISFDALNPPMKRTLFHDIKHISLGLKHAFGSKHGILTLQREIHTELSPGRNLYVTAIPFALSVLNVFYLVLHFGTTILLISKCSGKMPSAPSAAF